jgi:hypothetical protein
VCLVNQLNCRRLDRKFNVLEGFFRNYYFMVIFAISKSNWCPAGGTCSDSL